MMYAYLFIYIGQSAPFEAITVLKSTILRVVSCKLNLVNTTR